MRILGILFICIILSSCNHKNRVKLTLTSDSIRVDSKYSKGIWVSYFKKTKTTLGAILKLKIINDSCYIVQWGNSLKLNTCPDTLHLDGHETWIPELIAENKDYIVLRQGCGNPCWVGYFLPLNESDTPRYIHEYLDFNLKNNLVAFIKSDNIIEIVNLKTSLTEDHKTKNCTSAFPGYCIDSLSVKDKILKYKWFPKANKDSKKGILIKEEINI
jgi:hypothetical protein